MPDDATISPSPVPATVSIPQVDPSQVAAAERLHRLYSTYVVDSDETNELAAEDLKRVKHARNQLEEARQSMKRPVLEAGRAIDAFFQPRIQLLDAAERTIKGAIAKYAEEVEKRRIEEQRAAEAAAAAERARIEAEARAQAEAARKAEEEARAAIEAGNADAAAAAQQQAAQAQEAAAALTETAAVVTAPVIASTAPAVKGISTAKSLDFEVVDKLALVKHVAANPTLIDLLTVDSVRMRAYVRSVGEQVLATVAKPDSERFTIPGVRVFRKTSVRVSGR